MTVLLSIFAASCTPDEFAQAGDPDNENCYGVYFPSQEGTGDRQIDPEDPRYFTFKVRRLKTDDAITVPVTIKSDSANVFTLSELYFEEDKAEAEISVYFPSAQLGKTYECSLIIEDKLYASSYATVSTHLSFSVTRVKWNKVTGPNGETTGLYRDGVLRDWFALQEPDYEKSVTIEERDDMPGYYRIYDVYDADFVGALFQQNVTNLCISQNYTYINATDPDKVWIPTFKAGLLMMPEYGEISIASYVADNPDFDASIASVYGKLEEGVITFPSGSIQMKLENMGWYSANNSGKHRIIFPGYRAKDYALSLEAGVANERGDLPVSVEFGQDIVQVKLAVFDGELSSSTAAEMGVLIAENDPSVGKLITLNSKSNVYYDFEKTGNYTVVAAGFDVGGNLHTTEYVTFGYLAAGDDGRKITFSLGLIASDKYASEGLTSENALEIYMNGKHIERLHAGLYEKEKWQRDSAGIIKEITETQMAASYLAQVNGEGLSLKQGYLIPGTEYVLVAKVYNGFREELFVASEWTKGQWDARLATYDLSDITMDAAQASGDKYTGSYHNYSIASGMYSREYLGDVTIEKSSEYTDENEVGLSAPCYTITGLFPRCKKTYGLPDDSIQFFFYDGFLYNYKQLFGAYYWEGLYIYPDLLLMSTAGGAYSAYLGLMGGFVRDGYLAIVDSGQFARYDLEFNGYAVLAFSDENKKSFMGLLEMTTDILLVRSDLDPDPIVGNKGDEKDEWDEEDEVTKEQIQEFHGMVKKGPVNGVETYEGFLMSTADRIRSAVPKNRLNLETAKVIENPFEFHAPSFDVTVEPKID